MDFDSADIAKTGEDTSKLFFDVNSDVSSGFQTAFAPVPVLLLLLLLALLLLLHSLYSR